MILRADARSLPLHDGCVQCCVTSPPYFGLRDYGVTGQIGLESSPDAYVTQLVAVFREVRRVLRDDGTLWLNLGDSYTGSGKGGNPDGGKQATKRGSQTVGVLYGKIGETARQAAVTNVTRKTFDLGGKQLLGIPWRVAFALQADGWWLRSDIVWSKRNGMPESVTDRPTRSHEYLFLLAKSERYYYDAAAIQEQGDIPAGTRAAKGGNVRSALKDVNGRPPEYWEYTGTRNRRSVWHLATVPYAGAHFAVMPEKLVEPCVLAGSRPSDLVLDPFLGSGTVGRVATSLGRRFVGCDLNADYLQLAQQRTQVTRGLPLEATT